MQTDINKLKNYGQARNNELKSLGLSAMEINSWWQLKYKKKVTPKQWAYLLFDKELKWEYISAATCKSDLKVLRFPLLHLSFPMAMNVTKVVQELRGIKPVKAHRLNSYLRTNVDAEQGEDGVWSFE